MENVLCAILGTPDRVAFNLFGIDIMWYGIMLTSGIIIGSAVAYKRAPSHGIDPERWLDILLYCVPAGLIGARLYYVAFEWDRYKDNLLQIFNTRNGGLAIHGALLFGVGMGVFLLTKWKEKPLKWIDLAAPSLALAQSIGRWGNYFNQEAHGVETTLPWAIEIDGKLVHPTFLYESLWCLALFLFLLWFDKNHKKFDGQIFIMYAALYSVERFFVEGLRTDSLMIGGFRQAQLLSLGTIVVAVLAYVFLYRRSKKEQL